MYIICTYYNGFCQSIYYPIHRAHVGELWMIFFFVENTLQILEIKLFDFDFIDRRYVEQHHRPTPTVITTRTAITSNVHGNSSVSSSKSTTTGSSTKISDTVSRVQYNICRYIQWFILEKGECESMPPLHFNH